MDIRIKEVQAETCTEYYMPKRVITFLDKINFLWQIVLSLVALGFTLNTLKSSFIAESFKPQFPVIFIATLIAVVMLSLAVQSIESFTSVKSVCVNRGRFIYHKKSLLNKQGRVFSISVADLELTRKEFHIEAKGPDIRLEIGKMLDDNELDWLMQKLETEVNKVISA